MKKRTLSILLAVMLIVTFSLTGCGGSDKAKTDTSKDNAGSKVEAGMVDTSAFKKDGPYTIGFSNISVVNTWRAQMVHELEQEADKQGVKLYITDAGGDSAKQVSDIQDLLARGVDALLVAPGSSTATNAVTKKAIADGIPVIVFNAEVEGDDAFTGFVGSNAEDFGYTIGKWLVNELNGKGNIIILDGMAGNLINQQREDGLKKAIAELPDGGKNIKILATYYADWAYDKGKQSAEQALAAYPQIDGVFSQGGDMTRGALEAFKAAGRPLVPMTGEDNNGFLKLWKKYQPEGFKSIAASEPTWQSAVALDTALDALKGKPVKKYNYIPIPTITDSDIDQYVKMNYSDSYWCNSKLDPAVADKYYLEK